jgi:hypothetical protein
MKNLQHPKTLDPAIDAKMDEWRGLLASWPQSMVTVSIEAQVSQDGPWIQSQKNKPIKADDPNSDEVVAAWKKEADARILAGTLVAWRIILAAEPLIHSFSVPSVKKESGRVLAPRWSETDSAFYNNRKEELEENDQ